jgi:hypothetical protein
VSELPLQYDTGDAVANLYCLNPPSASPLYAEIEQFANAVDGDNDPTLVALAVADIYNRTLCYHHSSCNDCWTSAPSAYSTVDLIAAHKFAAAKALAAMSGTSSGGATAMTGTAGEVELTGVENEIAGLFTSAGNAIPVVGGIISAIGNLIDGHGRAVAEEQDVNCQASVLFTIGCAIIDLAVAMGKVSVSVATESMANLVQQCKNIVQPANQGYNWSWGTEFRLQGHLNFATWWYPQLIRKAPTHTALIVGGAAAGGGLIYLGGGV